MGAFGAILLSLVYGKFTLPSFFDSLVKALEITVLIMFLVAASNFFGAEFSSLGTPKMMTEMLLGLEMSPYLILILVTRQERLAQGRQQRASKQAVAIWKDIAYRAKKWRARLE